MDVDGYQDGAWRLGCCGATVRWWYAILTEGELTALEPRLGRRFQLSRIVDPWSQGDNNSLCASHTSILKTWGCRGGSRFHSLVLDLANFGGFNQGATILCYGRIRVHLTTVSSCEY